MWDFPKIRGTLFWGPYNKDPTKCYYLGCYIRGPYFRKPPCRPLKNFKGRIFLWGFAEASKNSSGINFNRISITLHSLLRECNVLIRSCILLEVICGDAMMHRGLG